MNATGVYVLKELSDRELSFKGWLCCPGCGYEACNLGWSGELTQFRRACDKCDGALVPFSTVAVSERYLQSHGRPSPPEMREYVTEYWEQTLAEGIVGDEIVDYELAGVMQHGEYSPHAVPRTETVDQTEKYAQIFTTHAENFGWDWRPTGGER